MSKTTQPDLFAADTISAKLLKAKKAYYDGKAIMSDADFDALEEELRQIDPKHSYFSVVGTPTNSKAKFKHVIPMLSAGKAKTFDEVEAWAKKMGITKEIFVAEPKIDGMSATCIYENGKLVTVATRGDGSVGQDVTHIASYMALPASISLKGRIEVRGELYLPKVNPIAKEKIRQAAVGLVNRKDSDLHELKHLHFVAYQVWGSSMSKENHKLAWLKENKFEVIDYKTFKLEAIEAGFQFYLDNLRQEWNYETDGQIFVVNDNSKWDEIDAKYEVEHHHHYMLAWKPPSEGKETELLDIEWNVSRNGKIIPVGIFKPIVLGGAKIQRATLNNFENVEKLALHKGDTIFVERANDVIPYFKENLTKHKPKDFQGDLVPHQCPSCKGKTAIEGVHLVCNNKHCPEQQVLKVIYWVQKCKMDQFGDSSVRALFDAKKVSNVRDLYSLKASDLKGLDGFGDSRIKNTLEQIDATREMGIGQFIKRLGVEGVGERAAENMEIKTEADFWAFNSKNITSKTNSVGTDFIEFRDENKSFVKELLDAVVITVPKVARKGALIIAMTGSGPESRDKLVKKIEAKGDTFSDHVGKETNVLLCEDPSGDSSKLKKAAKLGVKLLKYEDYFK